jgi:hypothetical protein
VSVVVVVWAVSPVSSAAFEAVLVRFHLHHPSAANLQPYTPGPVQRAYAWFVALSESVAVAIKEWVLMVVMLVFDLVLLGAGLYLLVAVPLILSSLLSFAQTLV